MAKKTKTPKKNVHVQKRENGWGVLSEGKSKPSKILSTQKEAIDRGRKISVNGGGGELIIHGVDGKIRQKDTTKGGNDPFPPRDTDSLPKNR